MSDMEMDDESPVESPIGDIDNDDVLDNNNDTDIMKDGSVTKVVNTEGAGWEKPKQHYEVMINLTGKCGDTVFESNAEENTPQPYILGSGALCKGLDETIKTMKKGEKASVDIAAKHAFGDEGCEEKGVPPGADVRYEVELVSWHVVEDVKKDGGVLVKTIKDGPEWIKPKDNDVVFVRYRGRLAEDDAYFVSKGYGDNEEPIRLLVAELEPSGLKEGLKACKKNSQVMITLRSEYAYGSEGSEELGVPPSASVAFEVELDGVHSIEDVSKDGGVVAELFEKPGSAWEKPKIGAKCTISFTAALQGEGPLEGRQFHEAKGVEVEIGADNGADITDGLEMVLEKMVKGQQAVVTVKPQYGYGAAGKQDWVGPNDVIEYKVTLDSMVAAPSTYQMSATEKQEFANRLRERGNAAFKEAKVAKAMRLYTAAVDPFKYIDSITDAEEKKVALPRALAYVLSLQVMQAAQAIRSACYSNLAACHDKTSNWTEAISACNKVLEHQPDNHKALFRRARAYMHTARLLDARQDVDRLLDKDAKDAAVVKLSADLRKKQMVQDKKDKAVYSKMFA